MTVFHWFYVALTVGLVGVALLLDFLVTQQREGDSE